MGSQIAIDPALGSVGWLCFLKPTVNLNAGAWGVIFPLCATVAARKLFRLETFVLGHQVHAGASSESAQPVLDILEGFTETPQNERQNTIAGGQ